MSDTSPLRKARAKRLELPDRGRRHHRRAAPDRRAQVREPHTWCSTRSSTSLAADVRTISRTNPSTTASVPPTPWRDQHQPTHRPRCHATIASRDPPAVDGGSGRRAARTPVETDSGSVPSEGNEVRAAQVTP
jgi:hypothetical protein